MREKENEEFTKNFEVVGELSDAAIDAIAAFLVDQYCFDQAEAELVLAC